MRLKLLGCLEEIPLLAVSKLSDKICLESIQARGHGEGIRGQCLPLFFVRPKKLFGSENFISNIQ